MDCLGHYDEKNKCKELQRREELDEIEEHIKVLLDAFSNDEIANDPKLYFIFSSLQEKSLQLMTESCLFRHLCKEYKIVSFNSKNSIFMPQFILFGLWMTLFILSGLVLYIPILVESITIGFLIIFRYRRLKKLNKEVKRIIAEEL